MSTLFSSGAADSRRHSVVHQSRLGSIDHSLQRSPSLTHRFCANPAPTEDTVRGGVTITITISMPDGLTGYAGLAYTGTR